MTAFKKPAPAVQNKAQAIAPVAQAGKLAQPMKVTKDMAAVFEAIAGIEDVDPAGNFAYFPPDFEGVCRVETFKIQVSPKKGKALIIVFIPETSNIEGLEGKKLSYYQQMDNYDYGQKALVQFVIAWQGVDQNDPSQREAQMAVRSNMQEHVLGLCAPDRDFEGEPVYVVVTTRNKPKQDGSPFTLHNFSPVPAEMLG